MLKNIFNRLLNPSAFGLNLSDRGLKIIKFKRGDGGLTLASFNFSQIPSEWIEQGEIRHSEKLIKLIKKTIREVKGEALKTKNVICSLPEAKSFLRIIQVAKNHQIKKAVLKEAKNHIPLPLNQIYLDWQIIPPFKNHLDHHDILIVAMKQKLVDQYLDLLEKVGLKPQVFEIESIATTRALIKNSMSPRPILIIDLGEEQTNFIIFSGHTLRFTATSEKIAFDELGEKIKEYISFYRSHATHEHGADGITTKVLLCGDRARDNKLLNRLRKELKISVDLADPWVNVPFEKKPPLSPNESLVYTTAIGLALRSIYD